jgi:RHS repeat-associated protein
MNGTAVSGVTLQIGVQSTRTDITGRFLLAQLPAGFAKLEIDGETANRPGAQYGYYAARVEVKPQQTTVVPYTIWMPRLDPAGIVGIAAPTTAEIVVSSPRIPGLELHIPAGTVVRDRHGGIVTELNITAIPVDRPPFPVPDLGVPVYFTVQPGGAILESASDKPTPGARLFYPNFKNEVPGARGVFWNYDSADRGWFVYGLGTISHEGRQSIPDDGVVIHEFTGAMFNGAGAPGPEGPPPCAAQTCCSADDMGIGDTSSGGEAGTCGFDGDPVSLYTGQFDRTERDLVLNDVMPISITRTYYSADVNQRAFGIGMTHQYDMFFFSKNQYQETDLLLPNGTRVHYARTSPGTDYHDAIMESNSPGVWKSSIVAYNTGRGGWDLTFRDGRKWFFGDNAPLLEMSDANGNVTSIIRSDGKSGRITRVVSPNGRTIDFSYTGGGLVSALTDSLGRSTFYNYDTNGHLIEMIDPLGGVREYGWDTINHRMTSIHDAGGKLLIQNEYDLLGRLTRQTLGDGSSYAYAYTLVNLSPTPPPGIPQPPPDIRVSRTDITNRRGMIRIVDFNPRTGDLVQSRFPAGLPDEQVNTYEYNDAQLTARIDALGRRTEYQYDTAGNTTQVTHLAGTDMAVSASVAYDGLSNRPLIITDSNGNVTTLSYDEKGNLLSAQNAPGEVWTYTYDAQGRRLTRTNPLGNVTTWSYDHADLVGVTDAIGRRVQLFSDTGGRLLSIVDSLGNRMVDRWDGLDRVLSITDPLGGITSVSYDASGNLVNHTDANGNATAYTYNARNKLQTTQDALGKIETLSYEPGGKVAQKTDRKGQLQSRIYDAVGRLHIIGFGATSGNPTAYTRQIENTWDAANRLTQIVETTCADPNGHPGCSSVTTTSTITRGYDDLNRMVREVTPLGQIDYTYDNAGRKTSMTITNGGLGAQVVQPTVTYSYDNADRLTGIHQAAADINEGQAQDIVLVYDKAGQRTQTRLANGVTVNYEYDDAGQNVSIVYNAADGSLIGDLQYEYDAAGSRTGVGGSLARTSLPAADTTDIAYDANNRLVRWDGQTYAYDDTGNLISDGANDYEWDENNRLIGIRNQGVAIAGFQYDSWGRRVGKTIGSETTGFLYDGANVAQELGGTTREAAVKAHVLSGRTDEVFLRMDGNSGANRQSVLSDSNNNTVMLLDAAQASVVSYTYEPYGMTTADGPSNNAYQYTGRENDNPGNSQGLYYCRARYYMPGIARFISQDPIGWASGQTNNYAYVGGDPISYLDPTGLGKGGKTRGPHMTESSNISDALEQESGIAGAQRRAREAGIGDDTIRSINKSEQNTDYRLSRIRNYADAQDDEEELEKVGEAAELVETEEGVRDTLETVEDVEESAGILARIGQLIDILE